MKCYFILAILLVAIDVMLLKNDSTTIQIVARPKTKWGLWGEEEKCENGSFAIGYYLKVGDPCLERSFSDDCDDTALNGIFLICQNGSSISSSLGHAGKIRKPQICPFSSILTGFKFRSEKPQKKIGDDTAGNDLHMRCSDGTILSNSEGRDYGKFDRWFNCPHGSYICGLVTLVEPPQFCDDDTGLNSVNFTCCYNNSS